MNQGRIILLSAITFILTAWFSIGYYHSDEHFQILEFAGLKSGLTDKANLPWEYHYQIRPAFQPLIAFSVQKTFAIAGITDPFLVSFILRLLSASIAFISIYLLYKSYLNKFTIQKLRNGFLLLSFFLWFALFNGVRFSSESFSGGLFVIGFASFMKKDKNDPIDYLITGILFGFSFLARYQTAFLIIGFAAWMIFIYKSGIRNLILFSLGLTSVFLLGILIDRWFYEEWILTAWNYFHQNIILGKASEFGRHPWWYYFEMVFLNTLPPFSLLYLLTPVIFIIYKPKDPITWTIVPFLLIHIIIPHKEIRFLFPMIGFLPIIIMTSAETVMNLSGDNIFNNKIVNVIIKTYWYSNLVLLCVVMFKPADSDTSLYKKIYYNYPEPTILYYTEDQPYDRAVDLNFYKRKNLVIQHIDSLNMIVPGNGNKLLVSKRAVSPAKVSFKMNLIYSSVPEWIKRFNFNNWIERTDMWYIYEVVKW